jgi:hypothetical protein
MEQDRICKICSSKYVVAEVHRNFGSDNNQTCWSCLSDWVAKCAKDPYRVGLAFLRNEAPYNVPERLVDVYKRAFEITQGMLPEAFERSRT